MMMMIMTMVVSDVMTTTTTELNSPNRYPTIHPLVEDLGVGKLNSYL